MVNNQKQKRKAANLPLKDLNNFVKNLAFLIALLLACSVFAPLHALADAGEVSHADVMNLSAQCKAAYTHPNAQASPYEPIKEELQAILQAYYVKPLDSNIFQNYSMEYIFSNFLDKYTAYFDPETFERFINIIDQRIYGIGVVVESVNEGLIIKSVLKDSPADSVGLKEGDIIVSIDGKSIEGISLEEATAMIKGPEGTKVAIRIKRGNKYLDYILVRKKIEMPTVFGSVTGSTGVIGIISFGTETAKEFVEVVDMLRNKGAKNWIIDVRDNSGGYLESALDIAGLFAGKERLLQTKDERGSHEEYFSEIDSYFKDESIVLLINENSASASEIFAAVLKDYKSALLIGNTTFGKGSIQNLYPLSNGGVLKLTVSYFYSPLGNAINGVGVKPDINILPQGEDTAFKAAQLLFSSNAPDYKSKEGMAKKLTFNGRDYYIDIAKARQHEYRNAYFALLKEAGVQISLSDFYSDYKVLPGLYDVEEDKKFKVAFTLPVDMDKALNSNALELVDAETGERIGMTYSTDDFKEFMLKPQSSLKKGRTYWLIFNKEIVSKTGWRLVHPAVVEVKAGW